MLNKWNLKVAEFTSKEESRYTLQAILVTPQATVATNGHYLAWVSAAPGKASDFPVIDHAPTPQDDFETFLLGTEDAKKIEKALPRKSTIPILMTAGVAVKDGQPIVEVTDLECPQIFRPKPPQGKFPNYDVVMPKDTPVIRFAVSATYLAKIAKMAAEFSGQGEAHDALTISVYGVEKSVRFDIENGNTGQGMTAVLMPMRCAGSLPAHTYGWTEPVAPEPEPETVNAEAEDAAETPTDVSVPDDAFQQSVAEQASEEVVDPKVQ